MKRLKLHINDGTKKMELKNLNPKEGRKEVGGGGGKHRENGVERKYNLRWWK